MLGRDLIIAIYFAQVNLKNSYKVEIFLKNAKITINIV
jgi:hypothetical protein